jgi:hypothetical protein
MLKGPSITAVCKYLGVGGLWTVCTDNDRGRLGRGEGRCCPASSARALVRLMGPGGLTGTY